MKEIRDFFVQYKNLLNVNVDDNLIADFEKYAELLLDWNNKINLTAIKEPKEIALKHFFDSLTVFNVLDIDLNAKVIDVGTGAGFPGVPLKLARKDLNLTLLDGLNKRLVFLKDLTQKLGINAEFLHSRAEELSLNKVYRENFDIAVSRAVAPLNILSEYCLPLVKKGGYFVSMKGSQADSEIENSKKAIEVLGGRIEKIEKFLMPDESKRCIIVVRKISQTPDKYPRHGSKISKKPL